MKKIKTKNSILAVSVLAVAVAALIFIPKIYSNKADAKEEMLTKYGLNNLSVKEIVSKLDHQIDEPSTLMAGLTGTSMSMYDGSKEYKFDIPKDSFYLSFAPYVNDVHPCTNHNLVTCRGEIMNGTFHITITDQDGKEIMNQEAESMDNGFIGVWLPSKMEGTLKVVYGSLSVEAPIRTFADSDTCVTTPLKLS